MVEPKMQFSPKLKKAMQEIKDIIRKNDIAALVILHTPGYSEFLAELSPSYSRVKIDNTAGTLRFKAKLQEDFNGDKAAQKEAVEKTINMLELITEAGAPTFMGIMKLNDIAHASLDIEDTGPAGFSSQTTQDS